MKEPGDYKSCNMQPSVQKQNISLTLTLCVSLLLPLFFSSLQVSSD